MPLYQDVKSCFMSECSWCPPPWGPKDCPDAVLVSGLVLNLSKICNQPCSGQLCLVFLFWNHNDCVFKV